MSVMNVKRSTQAFSKAEQTSSFKSDGAQAASAEEFQKAFGDQSVGDVLNKVADPNWIDPSKKIRTAGDKEMGKDAFMKLMLTQMKHQDPMNPMQSHEMAAQLAQFSSLEQMTNINSSLDAIKNAQTPSMNFQALALMGKKVSGDSSKVLRTAGDTKHGISFELLGDAANVKVTVKDANGAVVRKLDFGALKKGQNSVEWNGLAEDGTAARPGEYKISVEGVSNAGGKIYAKTAFGGRITGLNYTPEGPVLLVGKQSIKMSDVKKIEDAGPEDAEAARPALPLAVGANAPKKANAFMPLAAGAMAPVPVTPAPVKPEAKDLPKSAIKAAAKNSAAANAAPKAVADENVPPAEEPTETPNNLDSVPMAGELLAKVQKETY